MRGKLDDRYASYVQAAEKEKLLAALSVAEDWLYSDEGEDATKSVYVAQLAMTEFICIIALGFVAMKSDTPLARTTIVERDADTSLGTTRSVPK